jgi:hypothetical protein
LDQIRRIVETQDHEFVDSKLIMLLSRVYAFCEIEGHTIMDYPFVPFHVKINIVRPMMNHKMWQEN